MANNSNVLNFPSSKNKLYQSALESYESGQLQNALKLAISLIDSGDTYANTLAGAIYEKGGNGIEQDYDKALFYYRKAVDDAGSVEGWLALGRLHYFGRGVSQDYEKAFYYYSVVDEDTENHIAYLMLGRMYLEGRGVERDYFKAREYFEKAIIKGAIFGYSYLAMLEQKQGHLFKSLILRLKAGTLAFWVTYKNPNDSRLRR